jgi:hypothetical protein
MTLHKSLVLFAFLIFCLSCSPEKKRENEAKVEHTINIDQKKFEAINRAAKSIEAAITVGVNYQKFEQLLQDLATEILVANDKVSFQDEKKLLEIYSEVLTTYQDSGTLWHHKIQHPRDANGETYVEQDQEVSAITAKYNLSTRRPGGFFGDTEMILVDDSIKVIWAKAHDKLEQASTKLHGKGS